MARADHELPEPQVTIRGVLGVNDQADALVPPRVGDDEGRVRRPQGKGARSVGDVVRDCELCPGAVRRVAPPALPVRRDLGIANEAAPYVHGAAGQLVSRVPVSGRAVGDQGAPVAGVGERGAPRGQVDAEEGAPHPGLPDLDAARPPVGAPEHDAEKAGKHLPVAAAPTDGDGLSARRCRPPLTAGVSVLRREHPLHRVRALGRDGPGLATPGRAVLGEHEDAFPDVGPCARAADGAPPQSVTDDRGRAQRPPERPAASVAAVGRAAVLTGAGELDHVPVRGARHAQARGGDVPPCEVAVVRPGAGIREGVTARVRGPSPPLISERVGPVPELDRPGHPVHGDAILPGLVREAGDRVEGRPAVGVNQAIARRVEMDPGDAGDRAIGDPDFDCHPGDGERPIHDGADRPLSDDVRPVEEGGRGLIEPGARARCREAQPRGARRGQRGARGRRLRLRPSRDADGRLDGEPGLIP